jgi:hypothetical protein
MGRTTAIDAFGDTEKIWCMVGPTFFAFIKTRAASRGGVAETPAFVTTEWVRDGQADLVHECGHVDSIWEGGREREENSSGGDFRVAFHG